MKISYFVNLDEKGGFAGWFIVQIHHGDHPASFGLKSLQQQFLHRHKGIALLLQCVNDRKRRLHRGLGRIM